MMATVPAVEVRRVRAAQLRNLGRHEDARRLEEKTQTEIDDLEAAIKNAQRGRFCDLCFTPIHTGCDCNQ